MGRKADPLKTAFNASIINLIVALSKHLDGPWLCIEDIESLMKNGGIQSNITKTFIIAALKSKKNGPLANREAGNKKTKYYRSVNIHYSNTPPSDGSSTLPEIPNDFFITGDFEDELNNIDLYLSSQSNKRKRDDNETPNAIFCLPVKNSFSKSPLYSCVPKCNPKLSLLSIV